MKVVFNIYRFNNEKNLKPYYQKYEVDVENGDVKVLKALEKIKEQDPTLGFRRSCGEGVCGSDGMNINGKNRLSCITKIKDLKTPIMIRPLPGLPVIRDLIVDMDQFYKNYESIKPYVIVDEDKKPNREYIQSPEQRAKLDGLYECILCACCSTACPSFWWNNDKFIGPSGLLQALRFVEDSRDTKKEQRLNDLEDSFKVFRCRSIMSCVDVCPKELNPTKAINKLKEEMLKKSS